MEPGPGHPHQLTVPHMLKGSTMTNFLTLDALLADVEREYAPLEIELPGGKTVRLQQLIAIQPKERRLAVYAALDQLQKLNDSGKGLAGTEDTAAAILELLPLVADNEALGLQLVELIGDNLAAVMKVFGAWMDGTQAPEADSSPS